ncbi:antirestriction protein ArdA [Oscillibacter sp.]|uniref:antirestriction protein ArdA n=1 Tax=Oscillibacter sp. TaxID=1945593 RepID=UPI001B3F085A|nr:antirestriction protein ArdA [Oscillibacter sp.]MBP3509292.1 antirestriction protein ArdA [Oscillibacter sp.]
MRAVLSNVKHPEYGVATIPLPIPYEEYDHVIELLGAMELGDVVERDCKVEEIQDGLPILKRLEKVAVNIDELDYLAKRLDSFDYIEAAQFQAMAVKTGVFDMKDLINLTFCCQQATVITDFSDLEAIGRHHLVSINGGCLSSELADTDLRMTALKLILSKEGTVTPYGVVYDNGLKLDEVYDGRHLPGYHYEQDMLAVGISSRAEPENTSKITWLYLPCTQLQIERGMMRSGISDPDNMRIWYEDSQFPKEVENVLEFKQESLYDLNDLAATIKKLTEADQKKLGAAVILAEPECASQIRHLAENLDQFEFAPNVKTPEEYGKYMIQESGHFDYDENLDEFYDYEKYGQQRMSRESGMFTEAGYISYHGTLSLEELMMEGPTEQGFQMGGLQ